MGDDGSSPETDQQRIRVLGTVTLGRPLGPRLRRLRVALRSGVPDLPDAESPAVLTRAPGYLLRVAPTDLDAARFELLARRGGQRSPTTCSGSGGTVTPYRCSKVSSPVSHCGSGRRPS